MTKRIKHDRGNNKLTKPSTFEHPSTGLVVKALERLHWPRGSRKTLQEAVHMSLVEYDAWFNRLRQRRVANARIKNFKLYLQGVLPLPTQMVIEWFEFFHHQRAWRNDFPKDLKTMAWRPNHPHWEDIGNDYGERWCGEPKLWDQIMELTCGDQE